MVFDHCLSPACFATSNERLVLLTRIVAAASLLHELHPDFSGPLTGLPYRVLRFRLDAMPGWDNSPFDLSKMDSQSVIPASKADIYAVLETLRTASWDGAGQDRLASPPPFSYS
jgi:hypothetical protein